MDVEMLMVKVVGIFVMDSEGSSFIVSAILVVSVLNIELRFGE